MLIISESTMFNCFCSESCIFWRINNLGIILRTFDCKRLALFLVKKILFLCDGFYPLCHTMLGFSVCEGNNQLA